MPTITNSIFSAPWIDTRYNHRFMVTAMNTSGADLEDALVQVEIPSGALFQASTVRVLAVNPTGYEYSGFRYKQMRSPNSFYYLPVSVKNGMLTIKALGKWLVNETRTWGAYWNDTTSPIQYDHLGISRLNYTAHVVVGKSGDVYQITINSETYRYTQVAGDSAITIATTLATVIQGGTFATASNGSPPTATISFQPKLPDNSFTVSTSGTTTTANLAITSPNTYPVQRIGPNNESQVDGGPTQVSLPKGPIFPWNFVGMYDVDTSYQFMFANYYRGGNRAGFTAATQDTVDLQNNFITVQGKLFDPDSILSGTYAATYANHYITTPYSDGSGSWSLLSVNTVKLSYTLNVAQSFTSSLNGFTAFRLWDINENGATGGQYGSIPFFYQLPGQSIINANQGVGGIPMQLGVIVGSSSPTHVCAMRVDSVTSNGFQAASSKGVVLNSDSYGFSIGLTDLSQSTPIPAGATVTVNVTLLLHIKGLPVGMDSLTPSEAIRLLKSADPVQATAGAMETYTSDVRDVDIRNANDRLVSAVNWIQNDATKLTGLPWNYAYSYDLIQNQVGVSDDDDSTYGEGHVLHGLVLRYLRTKDQTLIQLIENSVNYFLSLNQLAESRFGSTAIGMLPYWTYPGPGTKTEILNGKTWTYQVGDPRALTSLEQSQMATHGLWAYLYLLRNQDPTLFPSRAKVVSLLQRMQQFETSAAATQAGWRADIPPFAQVVGNALYMATNGQSGTTVNNGVTTQYYNTNLKAAWSPRPPWYTQWMINNQSNFLLGGDSNATIVQFFRALFAPDSTNDGILQQLHWNSHEIVITDMGLHKVVTDSSTASFGEFLDDYPVGWRPRESTLYASYDPSSTPSHYLFCNVAGARDALFGKNPHYCLFLGFCALFDPSYNVDIDEQGHTINIIDLFMESLHVSAVHLMEPTTLVPRHGCSRFLGAGGIVADNVVDNCDLGYFMMAFEIYELVKQRLAGTLDPSRYYRFPGTYTPTQGGSGSTPSAIDWLSVTSVGASGSGQIAKGTIAVGNSTLTLEAPLDFANDQDISIANAGPICTIPTPTTPGVILGGGAGGTSTYGYRIAALDGKGGCSSASPEATFNKAPLNLTSMMTQGYNASWLNIQFTFQSNAVGYAIYRTTVPQGSALTTGFIGVFSYNDTPFVDEGSSVKTPPPGIPSTPPSAPVADYLSANILSGGGTNNLILSATAVTQAVSVNVYHDDAATIQKALDTGQSRIYFPTGTYYCSGPVHVKSKGQILSGNGTNSLISFLWNNGCLSLEQQGLTVEELSVDSNHQNNFCITAENSTVACHDLMIQSCHCTGAMLTGMDILNQNTTAWERISLRNNTCIDTLSGYWVQGKIKYVSVVDNKLDFTDFNYSGRGVCLRNYPTGYVTYATVVGNVLRCGNHTAGITIQGSGLVTITGNVILPAGGIFGVYCLGDANFDEQTCTAIISGNHIESLWPATGIAVCIENYKNVTVSSNSIRRWGFAFQVTPYSSSAEVVDSLSNGIRIVDNQLYQLDQGAISQQGKAPLSVKYVNNSGLNPRGVLLPSVSPLVPGTAYINNNNVDCTIYQQVYVSQSGKPGSIAMKLGSSSSPATLLSQVVDANSTSTTPDVVTLRVPQGWYYAFVPTAAALGPTTIFGD